jgi:hypothetical protein
MNNEKNGNGNGKPGAFDFVLGAGVNIGVGSFVATLFGAPWYWGATAMSTVMILESTDTTPEWFEKPAKALVSPGSMAVNAFRDVDHDIKALGAG